MWKIIIIITIFLIIVYVYSFLKIRKNKRNRQNETSYVEQYHAQLDKYRNRSVSSRQNQSKNSVNNYVTKYNSSLDYIEK